MGTSPERSLTRRYNKRRQVLVIIDFEFCITHQETKSEVNWEMGDLLKWTIPEKKDTTGRELGSTRIPNKNYFEVGSKTTL